MREERKQRNEAEMKQLVLKDEEGNREKNAQRMWQQRSQTITS